MKNYPRIDRISFPVRTGVHSTIKDLSYDLGSAYDDCCHSPPRDLQSKACDPMDNRQDPVYQRHKTVIIWLLIFANSQADVWLAVRGHQQQTSPNLDHIHRILGWLMIGAVNDCHHHPSVQHRGCGEWRHHIPPRAEPRNGVQVSNKKKEKGRRKHVVRSWIVHPAVIVYAMLTNVI